MTRGRGLAVAVAYVATVAPGTVAQTATVSGTARIAETTLARTVVSLTPRGGAASLPQPDSILIDQYELRFWPPVIAVVPGTTVLFRNSDPIMHNVFSPPGPGSGFNLGTYPRSESRAHVFGQPGVHVILCHVHPEMAAFVVVVETPYHAIADDAGRFTIADVPPGRYTLRTWHWRRAASEIEIDLRPGEHRTLEVEIHSRARGGRP